MYPNRETRWIYFVNGAVVDEDEDGDLRKRILAETIHVVTIFQKWLFKVSTL